MMLRFALSLLFVISYLPLKVLYVLFYPFYLFIHYVIKYRKTITIENLSLSFPEKSHKEILILYKLFQKHLADIGAEMVKMLSISEKDVENRYQCVNPEVVNDFYRQGKSVILLSSHYNNWEWMVLRLDEMFLHHGIGVGKANSNKCFEKWINKKRTRFGTEVVFADRVRDTFENYINQNKLCAYMMLGDQSPNNLKKSYGTTFLHQESCMIYGPEYFAKKYNFPVIYYEVIKTKRGYYKVHLELITDKPTETKTGEIIEKYIQLLEKTIKTVPQYWLWSHRRWKNR
ncbi:MAG: lysophospholipid acyltransferase family protein [Bacteroidetes bacterium]|nr:lysophospholipid acyltransferase family protein [Bacteroidota bacterium]MCL1968067.1 lysophospholipid acyltransferase family protein [Bacteroidota bacterium]